MPAISAAIQQAGGTSALADLIGVHKSTVSLWTKRRIPAERVLAVEAVTGVSRHELRPDVFGPTTTPAT